MNKFWLWIAAAAALSVACFVGAEALSWEHANLIDCAGDYTFSNVDFKRDGDTYLIVEEGNYRSRAPVKGCTVNYNG